MSSNLTTIGIVGTSWWTDAMYLPALATHPTARVTGLCGRSAGPLEALAGRWNIANTFRDWRDLLSSDIDAVIVASGNDSHYPITMAALDAGLHVLCEKPIALTAAEAWTMAERATEVGVVTMTPFTYRYMPMFQEVHRLLRTGEVGSPYHLNLRYFTEYARDPEYSWRFDRSIAGSGVIGDLASHWFHLAEWLMGPIATVSAESQSFVERGPRPDGAPYDAAEDSAIITVTFASGALGTIQVCAVSWVGTPFGQTHHVDLHGSGATVYGFSDWDRVQDVRVLPAGVDASHTRSGIADESWSGVRRDTVHNTYRDIFRTTDAMTRGWATAIARGTTIEPDLTAGARVQTLLDAALQSQHEGRRIDVATTGS